MGLVNKCGGYNFLIKKRRYNDMWPSASSLVVMSVATVSPDCLNFFLFLPNPNPIL